MTPILLALAAFQTAAGPPADPRHRACLDLVRADPTAAAASAEGWRGQSGAAEAGHCLGLALVALERWSEAAAAFERAAGEASAGEVRPADLQVQAANAWLAAGEPRRAVAAIDAALAAGDLADELRGEAHLDRARALVALGDGAGARRDLDRALELVAADPFAWYMSAALARREQDLPRARRDIARAVELAPAHPEILLFAGTLAGLAGDMAEAERLYRRVAEAAPDSEAGRAARDSLATLREVEE